MNSGSQKVVKYFIKSAPVGEVKEIIDDIAVIVGNGDFLQQPEIKNALRDHYEQHMKHLPLADAGSKVLITQTGRQEPIQREIGGGGTDEYGEELEKQYEVEEFVYYDPVQKIKFSFHPVTLDAKIEETNFEGNDAGNELKFELVQEMDKYVGRQFRQNTTKYAIFMEGNQCDIQISCHNLNFSNYWGGEWLSKWRVDLGNGNVTGNVKIHNHYFEQGNIQINLQKEELTGQAKEINAKAIVDCIDKLETQYQNSLDGMYEAISQNLLKGMRRVMTVVGTRFDWTRPNLSS